MLVQLDTFKHGNLALRLIQLLFSVIAISTIGAGFKGHDISVQDGNDDFTLSILYSSHTSQYVLLQTYTAMLFTLFYLILVETPLNSTAPWQPRRISEFIIDGVLAVLYLIGGIALSASSVVAHCDKLNDFATITVVRCGNLTCCCVFLFLAFVAHLGSMALVFFVASKRSFARLLHPESNDMQDVLPPQLHDNPPVCGPYGQEVTPKQLNNNADQAIPMA